MRLPIHFYGFGREMVTRDGTVYETVCGVFVSSAQLAYDQRAVTCEACAADLGMDLDLRLESERGCGSGPRRPPSSSLPAQWIGRLG